MATITLRNNFLEFELENETHLIAKANIKYVQLDEFVAIVDDSDRQRNNKRFLLKYDEITNEDFGNGTQFFEWLRELVNKETNQERDNRVVRENTSELKEIKELLEAQLKYLKKIYNHE